MTEMVKLTAKDFATDQEVRWCPGCGDYAVLKAVQRTMPDLGQHHEALVGSRARGHDVSHIHLRYIWPLPRNLGDLLRSYERIIVPEMNKGQLKTLLRDQYLVDARPVTKVSGQPFKIAEIEAAIEEALP